MKPLLTFYGGKQRLTSKILPILETIPHKVYVEPFAGGASLLFAKTPPKVSNHDDYRECLNDIDNRLITLYRVAKSQDFQLISLLTNTLYSQSDHQISAQILRNSEEYTDLEVAWAYYVNSQQGFAKRLLSGWGYGTLAQNNSQTWQNKLKNLDALFNRLKGVYISNVDALTCIDKWDSSNTLFYCDPPYPNADQGHYSGYTLKNYQRLIEKLTNIKGFFVLSNYTQDIPMPENWGTLELDATMSASSAKLSDGKREKRKELLFTNAHIELSIIEARKKYLSAQTYSWQP